MTETYTIHSEQDGTRVHFMSGVSGRDAMRAAKRLRQSGCTPVVYSERDGARLFL